MLTLPDSMARARYAIQTFPEKLVVFTGAGISAESGISTFRDADTGAIWDKYDPEILSSLDGFMDNPALVWGWYAERLMTQLTAEPNPGHYALTFNDAPVITQNVDTLHERAGSTKVTHMHGRADKAKCTACNWEGDITDLDISKITDGFLPQCPACGDLARPDVVWFGEFLKSSDLIDARALLRQSICLVVGTSGVVEPMASMPSQYADLIISVNPRAEDHISGAIQLTGKGSEILTQLFA